MAQNMFKNLGLGLGLRAAHYNDVLGGNSKVEWFEALTENYINSGGRSIAALEQIRQDHQVALHGVSLSIASSDKLDKDYLTHLKNLIDIIDPAIVSDHCCWTSLNGKNLHDLMPVPYTREAVDHIVTRVKQVQDFLGRRILLENVSSYIDFNYSEMTEWQFLNAIATGSDCGLLLDVNNIYVNSVNHGFKATDFIQGIPMERVGQIHLAGHTRRENSDGTFLLIDTHDAPVCNEVWSLYSETLRLAGSISTMVEWDADIPEYEQLEAEVLKAKTFQEASHVAV
jgi:uncharacterized protein (UPF0276 family)